MDHGTWLDMTANGITYREIARRGNTTAGAISAARKQGKLSPNLVIAISRACGKSPIQGLIETGYIQESELTDTLILREATDPTSLTGRELIEELAARINLDQRR